MAGARPSLVLLDLNGPEFLSQFFALDASTLSQVVQALGRLRRLSWADVYKSQGLKWEKVGTAPNGAPLHSLRLSLKVRAIAFRQGDYLRLVSLHPDHDSAYD